MFRGLVATGCQCDPECDESKDMSGASAWQLRARCGRATRCEPNKAPHFLFPTLNARGGSAGQRVGPHGLTCARAAVSNPQDRSNFERAVVRLGEGRARAADRSEIWTPLPTSSAGRSLDPCPQEDVHSRRGGISTCGGGASARFRRSAGGGVRSACGGGTVYPSQGAER